MLNQKKYKKINKVGFDEPKGWEKEPYMNLSQSSSSSDSSSDSDSETETETETETEQDYDNERSRILQEETDFIIIKKNSLCNNIKKHYGSCPENFPLTPH